MNFNMAPEYMRATHLDLSDIANNRTAITERLVAYMSTLVVKSAHVETEAVSPDTLEIGNQLFSNGYVGEIAHITICKSAVIGTVYGVHLDYVSGDIDMFRYFLGSICNGCFTGTRAYIQGNSNRAWMKVIDQ